MNSQIEPLPLDVQSKPFKNVIEFKPGIQGGHYTIPTLHGIGSILFKENSFSKRDKLNVKIIKSDARQVYLDWKDDWNSDYSTELSLASDIFIISYTGVGRRNSFSRCRKMVELELPLFSHVDRRYFTFILISKSRDDVAWNYVENYKTSTKNTFRVVITESTMLCLKCRPISETVKMHAKGFKHTSFLFRGLILRIPKLALQYDDEIVISCERITNPEMEKLRNEYDYEMSNVLSISPIYTFSFNQDSPNEQERRSSYVSQISEDNFKLAKRMMTIQLPLPPRKYSNQDEILENDALAIFRLCESDSRWKIMDKNFEISRNVVSFHTNNFGSFVVVTCDKNRSKYNLIEAMKCIRTYQVYGTSGQLMVFGKFTNRWVVRIEVVRSECVDGVCSKLRKLGYFKIETIVEDTGPDMEDTRIVLPTNRRLSWARRKSSVSINDSRKSSTTNAFLECTNSRIEKTDGKILRLEDLMLFEINFRKSSLYNLSTHSVKIWGNGKYCENDNIETFEESLKYNLIFHRNAIENFVEFYIDPSDEVTDDCMDLLINLEIFGKRRNNFYDNVQIRKNIVYKVTNHQISIDIVQEYLKDKKQEIIIPPRKLSNASVNTILDDKSIYQESIETAKIRKKRQSIESFNRLTSKCRTHVRVQREPRVLSRHSISILSSNIACGLTLGVELNLDDSTITGIGFDAVANGYSLSNITYKILLLWKRKTAQLYSQQVEILCNALCRMNLTSMANTIQMFDANNCQLMEGCFQLSNDKDYESNDKGKDNDVKYINDNGLEAVKSLPNDNIEACKEKNIFKHFKSFDTSV